MVYVFEGEENIVGQVENAGYQYFLAQLFSEKARGIAIAFASNLMSLGVFLSLLRVL